MGLTRKSFLTGSLAVGALAVLHGCGSSDDGAGGSGGDGGSAGTGGGAGAGGSGGGGGGGGGAVASCTNGANGPDDRHGHTVSIPQADIDNPQDGQYTSTDGGHPHTFTVTAAELTELANNGSVTVSSSDGHAHTWMITCG